MACDFEKNNDAVEASFLQSNHSEVMTDEHFERFTRLACQILETPMSVLYVLGPHGNRFVARQGLHEPLLDIDVSFFIETMKASHLFEVSDASSDPRFSGLYSEPETPCFRYFLGMPLFDTLGTAIGVLCVFDHLPKMAQPKQLQGFSDLAGCVQNELSRYSHNQLDQYQQFAAAITRAQSHFIGYDPKSAFNGLLQDILDLTHSEYGFIGEVFTTMSGDPYLKTHAITNIAWNDETRQFYQLHAPKGLEFYNLHSLFGAALRTKETVISNTPANDPRRCGLPDGHPALNCFLGLPVVQDGQLIAMLGIANRPGGYTTRLAEQLSPLLATIGQLVMSLRLQQKRVESEQRVQAIIDGSNIGTWEWNIQTGETLFNQRWLDILGYSPSELQPLTINTWIRLVHPDDLEQSDLMLQRCFRRELEYYDCEVRMLHKSGHWVWVHDRGKVISWTPDSKPLMMYGSHEDVSERKHLELIRQLESIRKQRQADILAEIALSKHYTNGDVHQLARQLTETVASTLGIARVGVWLFDENRTQLLCLDNYNLATHVHDSGSVLLKHEYEKEFEALMCAAYVDGHDAQNDPRLAGYRDTYLVPLGITSMLDANIRAEGKALGTLCFEYVNTPHVWTEDEIEFACRLADQVALTVLHRDRKATQSALAQSEAQYRSLVANIPGITYRCLQDKDWTMLYMSDQVEDVTGYPAKNFYGNSQLSFASVIHPDDQKRVQEQIESAITLSKSWSVEYRIIHKHLGVRWVKEHGRALYASSGAVIYLDGFILDINEEMISKEQSQRHLQALTVLQSIASHSSLDTTEHLEKALQLGATYLGLELGIVSYIENDDYTIRAFTAPAHMPLARGMSFKLGQTYCDLTLANNEIVPIHHMGQSKYAGHPCYKAFSLESYIGVPLWVENRLFGTLNFSSVHPRSGPFSDSEKLFVRLMSGWVGATLEQQITIQKTVNSESRLRGLFDLSPIGIALVDFRTGRVLEVNASLLGPTGYSELEIMQMPQQWLGGANSYSLIRRELLERADRFGPYEDEFVRKDGSSYPVALYGVCVREDNGRVLVWTMVEDISSRKHLDRMKSELISTISHELRTPLTAINGALGLIHGGVLGQLPKPVASMVNVAYENSERLGLLVNDLLDMDKLVAGKMKFDIQPLNLKTELERSVQSNSSFASRFGVHIVLDDLFGPQQILADSLRLQQVLANLLSNAAKFSSQGQTVSVSVEVRDSVVRVLVKDHGVGIAPEYRDKIFQKFSQIDSSDTRIKGGTGLGLAISKELITRMNGDIGFESNQNGGCTFFIDLPIFEGHFSLESHSDQGKLNA